MVNRHINDKEQRGEIQFPLKYISIALAVVVFIVVIIFFFNPQFIFFSCFPGIESKKYFFPLCIKGKTSLLLSGNGEKRQGYPCRQE